MKEELKQAIEEYCEKWILDCSIENTDEDNFNQISSIVLSTPSILRHADPEIMKQAGWESSEWINVKDRLPNGGVDVLVWNGKFYFISTYAHGTKSWFYQTVPRYEITHWKPLPQPPKQ